MMSTFRSFFDRPRAPSHIEQLLLLTLSNQNWVEIVQDSARRPSAVASAVMASLSADADNSGSFPDVPDSQRHDRIQQDAPVSDQKNGDVDISLPQKMLSATIGSVFTSLLGIVSYDLTREISANNFSSDSPRRRSGSFTIPNKSVFFPFFCAIYPALFIVQEPTFKSRHYGLLSRGSLLAQKQLPSMPCRFRLILHQVHQPKCVSSPRTNIRLRSRRDATENLQLDPRRPPEDRTQ